MWVCLKSIKQILFFFCLLRRLLKEVFFGLDLRSNFWNWIPANPNAFYVLLLQLNGNRLGCLRVYLFLTSQGFTCAEFFSDSKSLDRLDSVGCGEDEYVRCTSIMEHNLRNNRRKRSEMLLQRHF